MWVWTFSLYSPSILPVNMYYIVLFVQVIYGLLYVHFDITSIFDSHYLTFTYVRRLLHRNANLPARIHCLVSIFTLHWRHNDHDGVSNHQPHGCLLNVYSDADQRKHQSSASLAFVWGIHRDRWIPRTKGQLRGKCFHLMTSSWSTQYGLIYVHTSVVVFVFFHLARIA